MRRDVGSILYGANSRSSQCSTTDVTKAVAVLSIMVCAYKNIIAANRKPYPNVVAADGFFFDYLGGPLPYICVCVCVCVSVCVCVCVCACRIYILYICTYEESHL